MKHILSLSGGGSSGYIHACFIEKIQQELGVNIVEVVDLIAGVSAGSIIGTMLSLNFSIDEIKYNFKYATEKLVKSGNKYRIIYSTIYKKNVYTDIIRDYLHDKTMEDLNKPLMVHALQVNYPNLKTKIWKSWKDDDKSVKLVDVIASSSAVPGGFPPHQIGDDFYIDGGLILNNPSLYGYVEARKIFDDKDIKVLSLQTDKHLGFKTPKKLKGIINISKYFPELAVDGTEDSINHTMTQLLGDKYEFLNPSVYEDVFSVNWESMEKSVEKTWQTKKDVIMEFLTT